LKLGLCLKDLGLQLLQSANKHFKTVFGTGMCQMLAGAAQAAGQLLSTVGAAGMPSIP
jgi:hypothetical protein